MQVSRVSQDVEATLLTQQANMKTDHTHAEQTKTDNHSEAETRPSDEQDVGDKYKEAEQSYFYRDKAFEFSVHKQTKQIIIKVIDKHTQEVIKEIPEEKILDMVAKMCENAGLYIDEKK